MRKGTLEQHPHLRQHPGPPNPQSRLEMPLRAPSVEGWLPRRGRRNGVEFQTVWPGGSCVLGTPLVPWPRNQSAPLHAAYYVKGVPHHSPDYGGIDNGGLESPKNGPAVGKGTCY